MTDIVAVAIRKPDRLARHRQIVYRAVFMTQVSGPVEGAEGLLLGLDVSAPLVPERVNRCVRRSMTAHLVHVHNLFGNGVRAPLHSGLAWHIASKRLLSPAHQLRNVDLPNGVFFGVKQEVPRSLHGAVLVQVVEVVVDRDVLEVRGPAVILPGVIHHPSPGGAASFPICGYVAEIDPDQFVKKRSEEHTSELQSPCNLVCRLLLEKKKKKKLKHH